MTRYRMPMPLLKLNGDVFALTKQKYTMFTKGLDVRHEVIQPIYDQIYMRQKVQLEEVFR